MKRLTTILILGILLFGLVLAADNTNQDDVSETATSQDTEEDTKDIQNTVGEFLDKLKEKAKEFKKNESLRQYNLTKMFTTELPVFLEKPTRIAFNIDEGEEVSLEKFVILIALTIMSFLIAFEIMDYTSFETPLVKYVISIGLVVIGAILGSINQVVNIIVGFNAFMFGSLGKIGQLTFIIWTIAMLVLGVMFRKFNRKIKANIRLYKAKAKGIVYGSKIENTIKNAETLVKDS